MRLHQRLVALLAALIVALGIGAAISTPASADLLQAFQIRVNGTNKCLDVTNYSYADGAKLQMYTCLGGSQYNQLFFLRSMPGYNNWQIVAEHSGKCLDVEGVSQANGALIQQYTCLGTSQLNQIFNIFSYGGNSMYTITAQHSYQDVTYAGLFNGAQVYQWPGIGDRWNFVSVM